MKRGKNVKLCLFSFFFYYEVRCKTIFGWSVHWLCVQEVLCLCVKIFQSHLLYAKQTDILNIITGVFYDKKTFFLVFFVHFLKIKIQKRSTERDNRSNSSVFSFCVNTVKRINVQTLQIRIEGAIETQSLTFWKTLLKRSRQ